MPWITNLAPARNPLAGQAEPRPAGQPWYTISNTAADEAEVLLYDEIGGWFGAGADAFVDELKAITAPRIALRVNSPGGSVFEGVAIANALRAHPATVTVYVDGIAASIASIIALAGDRLVMRPQSQMMIHDASGLTIGNSTDMREMADLLDKQSDNLADAYAEKAGGTRQEWRARMQAESWYSAQEAVDAGLADEVQSFRKQPAESASANEDAPVARWDLSVFRYAGREEAPAPQTAAAPEPATGGLTVQLGDQLDEQLVAMLRDWVNTKTTPAAALGEEPVQVPTGQPAEVAQPPEPEGPDDADPAEPVDAPEQPTETDPWADATAHLYTNPDNGWAALTAHLTTPCSAATTA